MGSGAQPQARQGPRAPSPSVRKDTRWVQVLGVLGLGLAHTCTCFLEAGVKGCYWEFLNSRVTFHVRIKGTDLFTRPQCETSAPFFLLARTGGGLQPRVTHHRVKVEPHCGFRSFWSEALGDSRLTGLPRGLSLQLCLH